jgi:hypothetical protein
MYHIAAVWEIYNVNQVAKKLRDGYTICMSYQWYEDSKVSYIGLDDYPEYFKEEPESLPSKEILKDMYQRMWNVLDTADMIVAHNGKAFDIKKLNGEFFRMGMPPPSFARVTDTKNICKRSFGFASNKLEEIVQIAEIGRKLPNEGIELWAECDKRSKKKWKIMKAYCMHDTALLKPVFERVKPWMAPVDYINWNLELDRPGCCPVCGSLQIKKDGSWYYSKRMVQKYRCTRKGCGKCFAGETLQTTRLG